MKSKFYRILYVRLLMCVMLLIRAMAVPVILPATVYDPEEAAGKVEGDMVLTETQKLLFESPIQGRNGLVSENLRWPSRVVIYKIIDQFDTVHKTAILEGIDTIETQTCVRFREATDEDEHYVAITAKPGGCYTAVGYQAKVQEMNLEIYNIGEGCFRPGTIVHELMHALGFYHEQSSAIRDDYITVIFENIVPGKEFNFQKYSSTFVSDFDVGYDYQSCLHYRPGAFSINGEDTIVPKDASAKIGQRLGPSKKDIDKINIMYKCPIKI